MASPSIAEVHVADDPAAWERLGFAVDGGACRIGPVVVRFVGGHGGIVACAVTGDDWAGGDVDGLALPLATTATADDGAAAHPNGAIGIDHLVAATDDTDRTVAAFAAAGLEPRRRMTVRRGDTDVAMAFFRLGPLIVEVAALGGRGAARWWGFVAVVADLDATASALGDALGRPRAAVQPGRRIATARPADGLGTALAFMTPPSP